MYIVHGIAAADRFPGHIFTTSFTIRNPNKPLISAAGRPPFKIRHGSNAGPSITRLTLTKRLIRNAILRPVTSVLNATSISIRERERLGDSNSTEFQRVFSLATIQRSPPSEDNISKRRGIVPRPFLLRREILWIEQTRNRVFSIMEKLKTEILIIETFNSYWDTI